MVIDPGADVPEILDTARKEGLTIKTIFNTHHHWDHIAGNESLKEATGAQLIRHALEDDIVNQEADVRTQTGTTVAKADRRIEGDDSLVVGNITFDIIFTPGHTPGGLCLYAEGQLFTGDTLFVGDSGRTDLPGGHRPTLGASIRRLMKLPDDTVIWPGHDYGPTPSSTIYNEKRTNVNAREYGYSVDP
jgi:glyoxylase-like metal-dependent hydrolase (beta-lactamase superfamily II)